MDGCLLDFKCEKTSNHKIGKKIPRRKSPSIHKSSLYVSAKTVHLDTENELIYANLDGEVKGFKNPTIEIVEKAIRLALPRIS